MNFVVLFEDNPDAAPDIRKKHMADHLTFLESNSTCIQSAGPLSSQDGTAAGGLWLVDADDPTEVDALVKEDPFWPTGLRKTVRILSWKKVYEEGHRLTAD